jgi:hypothetical protein
MPTLRNSDRAQHCLHVFRLDPSELFQRHQFKDPWKANSDTQERRRGRQCDQFNARSISTNNLEEAMGSQSCETQEHTPLSARFTTRATSTTQATLLLKDTWKAKVTARKSDHTRQNCTIQKSIHQHHSQRIVVTPRLRHVRAIVHASIYTVSDSTTSTVDSLKDLCYAHVPFT